MVERRDFIRNLTAAGTGAWMSHWLTACSLAERHPSVGVAWPGWKPGEFQVHFIYTGVAESQFLIFPDGTSMLLDCGDHPAHTRGDKAVKILPSMDRHAGEWVARYVGRVNPNGTDVDYMMLTHFHSDHSGGKGYHAGRTTGRNPDYYLSGFAQAAETLHFRTAIDRGWPDYTDPIPFDDDKGGGTLRNMKALYAHLAARDGLKVEKFRLGASDQIVQRHAPKAGFEVFNFAVNGRLCSPETGEIFEPYRERIAQGAKKLNENAMSIGTLFNYGAFTYYAAGDLSDNVAKGRRLEDELAKIMPKVDVAKINHHGHHSMFEPLAKALDARCYVACVWDQLHCTGDTMAALETGPGPHTYFPGIVPTWEIKDGVRPPWMAKAAVPCWEGAHTVLTVQPGGHDYTMTLISAADESMTVRGVLGFQS